MSGGAGRIFHQLTHQEVALFAKQILQLCAKHCNLPIVSTVSLGEKDNNRFNTSMCDHNALVY